MGKIFEVRLGGEQAEAGERARAANSPLRFRSREGTFFLGEDEYALARLDHPDLEVVRSLDEREVPIRFILPHDGAVNNQPPESARQAVVARLLAEGRASGDQHVRFLGRNRSVPLDGFVLDTAGGRRQYVWQLVDCDTAEDHVEFRQRFQALRARFTDPDTKVVLALGSGGLKLFAHSVALRLLERLGCADAIEEIWGSSGGAVVGLLYSHGLSPQAIEQTGYDLYSGRYQLTVRPSRFQVLRHLLRDSLLPSPHRDSAGFFDLAEGLSRMLEHYCETLQPRRPFFCTAFNLADCRPEVLTPDPVPDHLASFVHQTDPREAALASAAVPLLFLPRRIERSDREVPYVDGSTTEDVPLYSAARKWDADRAAGVERRRQLVIFYVKLTGELAMYRTQAGRIGKIRLLQTVAAAGIETMHNRDVELVGGRDDVSLLPLELADTSPDFFDLSGIPSHVRRAKECFPPQLEALEARERSARGGSGGGAR